MKTTDSDHQQCGSAVRQAIKKEILVVPDMCSKCGQSSKVEAHHYLGYEREHELDIQWLCKPCHKSLHSKSIYVK